MDKKTEIYESLLNEIASLEKECGFIYIEYIREFGDELNNIFSLKVDAIKLKKKIAYCIRKQNRNETVDIEDMEKAVEKLLTKYKNELKSMIQYKIDVDKEKGKKISFDQKRNIKLMYYKIVHMIHPDLHPELTKDKKIKELWQKCVDAYKCNDEKALKRVYDHVLLLITPTEIIEIEDIDEKISILEDEIKEIKDTNPYKFKFILDDEDEKLELHKKHRNEEDYYKNYICKLSEELNELISVLEKKCDA